MAIAVAGPFCFVPVAETDIGWHLALGRLIVHQGLPHTNSLAWTQPDHPFYATSWLFDVAAWAATSQWGLAGLQALTFMLLAGTLIGVTVACAAVSSQALWVPAAVASLVVPRVTPRPHMASWLLLAVCLALCLWAFKGRGWLRALCVPLIALGSNLHAGAMFSTVVLGVFCLEALWRERRWARELAIGAAGGLALMVNPGGPYNVWYMATHLKLYDAIPIQELQSPKLGELPAFWALILPAVALAIVARKQTPALMAAVALFAVAGAFAARLAFKFYVVAGPAFAAGAEALKPRQARALAAAVLVLGASANASRYARLELAPRWDEHELPVRAVAFIREHALGGRFYNSFGDGGYLTWELPDRPVFQDARALAYSHDFYGRQLAAEGSPERFEALMGSLQVDWALTSATPGALTGAGLLTDQRWALVYWDDLSEIRVRRDGPLASLLPLEFRVLRPDRTPEQLLAAIGGASDETLAQALDELARLRRAAPSPELLAMFECAFAARRGGTPTRACAAGGHL
ncbi:MAG: hypothetical protein JNK82_37665 [Myxococcaceae bacterium]|nr:hypothetical protein [Myxococcaceae bacterium]